MSIGWVLVGLALVGALLFVLLSPSPRTAFAELGKLLFFAALLVLLLHVGAAMAPGFR
jgi:hypothetical protein